MTSYGQFCPVAKAMEVLDERWTLLVVRELLSGSSHFNELRRGVPKMSSALLSKRLRSLERAGVLQRETEGGGISYELTRSGKELATVVTALGTWGTRWISALGQEDLDPHLLMWDVRRSLPVDKWPRTRTVLAVSFDDIAPKVAHWWLVVAEGHADVCDYDPGFETTATVATSLRTLTGIWRGDITWASALRNGSVKVSGPAAVRRAVPQWLGHGNFAGVARPG